MPPSPSPGFPVVAATQSVAMYLLVAGVAVYAIAAHKEQARLEASTQALTSLLSGTAPRDTESIARILSEIHARDVAFLSFSGPPSAPALVLLGLLAVAVGAFLTGLVLWRPSGQQRPPAAPALPAPPPAAGGANKSEEVTP